MAVGILNLVTSKPRGYPIQLRPPPTQAPIRVYVSGAVNAPGVYELPIGSVVQDALDAADGAASDAQFGSLNLAAPLNDGDQIHLSSLEDNTPEPQSVLSSGKTLSQKININTADTAQLESLPGIGPSLAGKIIDYREENGSFTSVDELLLVSGIGPAKLEQIQDFITVH